MREYVDGTSQTTTSFVNQKYDNFMVEQDDLENIYWRTKFEKKLESFVVISNHTGCIRDLKIWEQVEFIYQMKFKQHDLINYFKQVIKKRDVIFKGMGSTLMNDVENDAKKIKEPNLFANLVTGFVKNPMEIKNSKWISALKSDDSLKKSSRKIIEVNKLC